MGIIESYLIENAAYVSENSAVALSSLPDDAWTLVLAGLEELNSGATEPGIDCDVALTHETLTDFDHARAGKWADRGNRTVLDIGIAAVLFERVQLCKGQPRRSFIVIDLGEIRVVLS
jgi:hypothetical protein